VVDPDPPREPGPKLVFFDLDGTISRHDTLIGYVWGYALRHPWRILGFLRALPALLGFLLGRLDRGALKGALIRGVMQGSRRQSIDEWTHAYIGQLIERGCFGEARRTIESHRQAGDHLILMTATVDLYASTNGSVARCAGTVIASMVGSPPPMSVTRKKLTGCALACPASPDAV
jgi:phosphoserine phosphatase